MEAGMDAQLPAGTMQRSRGSTALAIIAGTGGALGTLASSWLLTVKLGGGVLVLLAGVLVLAFSGAELAFAYGAWKQSRWARRTVLRAVGLAVAVALIALGIYVSFSIPVRELAKFGG